MSNTGGAGRKGPQRGPKGPVRGPVDTQQISADLSKLHVSPPKDPRFPSKPTRPANQALPGRRVRLISNLFRLSIKQNKPIYLYSVTIDLDSQSDSEDAEKKSLAKPKLSKDLRQEVLKKAIEMCIKESKPKDLDRNLKYNYVFESLTSNLYTLFDIFGSVSKESGKKSKEIIVPHDLDRIQDQKVVLKKVHLKVKIFEGRTLNLSLLSQLTKHSAANDDYKELFRAVNAIVRGQLVTLPNYVLTRTNVFPLDPQSSRGFEVSAGVVAHKGYFISAKPAECGLVLNVANTLAPFYREISLIDFLVNKFRVDLSRPLKPDVIDKLKRELLNKQIEARHQNYGKPNSPHYRRYRVSDINSSATEKFCLIDKKTKSVSEVTIQDYFLKEYKYKLKHPHLPCVVDKGRKIPLEVCHIIDKQRVMRKMDPDETAKIIKISALPADQHFKEIDKSVKDIQSHGQVIKDFGVELDPKNIEVDGRELTPLALIGSDRKPINPSQGQYDTRNSRFLKPAVVSKWALAFLMDQFVQRDRERDESLGSSKFSELYTKEARSKGMTISNGDPFYIGDQRKLKDFFQFLNENKFDHCIFVLPKSTLDSTYRQLQYYEASSGGAKCTRISCVKYDNYRMKVVNDRFAGTMFLNNLLLKYNTKLGGVNFGLYNDGKRRYLQDGYIFISVDVCHPGPGDKLIQSVAAVVGMWNLCDETRSTFTRLKVQKKMSQDNSTIEQVIEIGEMFAEVIESYRARKNKLPTKIIIMRDGVSEGQLRMVIEYEIKSIYQHIKPLYQKYNGPKPQLSCIVVQKRHKTRFRRVEPIVTRKGDNDYNIQPGTVVDNTVTHPTDFTFYIAPHKAIQGTSRPIHMWINYDEIGFSQDEAQELVHAMSYLSPRCTKSTAIPTPVNLADLAAERGKNLVICWVEDQGSKLKMKEDERLKKINQFLSAIGDKNYSNTLYYI